MTGIHKLGANLMVYPLVTLDNVIKVIAMPAVQLHKRQLSFIERMHQTECKSDNQCKRYIRNDLVAQPLAKAFHAASWSLQHEQYANVCRRNAYMNSEYAGVQVRASLYSICILLVLQRPTIWKGFARGCKTMLFLIALAFLVQFTLFQALRSINGSCDFCNSF